MAIQTLTLNVNAQPSAEDRAFLYLSQNENGRDIRFRVLGDDLPSGCTATLSGVKPDGNVWSKAGTVTNNFVTVEEDIQMTAVAGRWDAQLDIVNGSKNIVTALIRITVEAAAVEAGAVPSDTQLEGYVEQCKQYAETAKNEAYGSPLTAATAAAMTDQRRVYVYTGSETGYTAGHWYYYNGTVWTDGGVYNAVAVDTDTTLSVSGKAADAKKTGDEISQIKEDLRSVDLVDRTAILFGYLNSTGGEVYPNPANINHEIMTDFIPVTSGKDYTMFWWGTLSGGYWHRLCWYDSSKAYISNSTYNMTQQTSGYFYKITDYTAPSNAAYVRISTRSYDDGVFSFYTGRIKHAEKPNWYDFVNAPHVTDSANVKSINHAGYSGTDGAPENTIPAFVQSKAHGFDFIECDTAVTKDGVVVCIHDNTIDRTSDGTGNVRDLTYEQLLQYDFGSWKSEEYAGTKIPKLEEVLDVCKALRLHPYIEIKYNGLFTREEVEQIVDLVRSKGMLDSVTFISFSPQQLGWVMSAYKYARLGLITNTAGDSTINFTDWAQIRRILQILRNGVNSVFANVRKETIDPTHTSYIEGINKVYSYDFPVECWTVYDTRFWFGRVDKCVNGFTTVTYKYDDWAKEQYGLEV